MHDHQLPLIRRFLEFLEVERNFSAHTIRSYSTDLAQFCQFLLALDDAGPAGTETLATEDLPALDADSPGKLQQRVLKVEPLEVRA